MLLALNIGNTHLTGGVFDGEGLLATWQLSTQTPRTADELAAFFHSAFASRDFSLADVRGVAVCSVVAKLTSQAVLLARHTFNCEALVIGPQTATGLINDYDNPAELGADRLVNGVAAFRRFGTAVLVADLGTATTIDAVSSDGHFRGGAIAPGLGIAADALLQAAPRLPRVELKAPPHALARNTKAALQSGLVFGYAGLVKELLARCAVEMSEDVTIIATGGLASIIAPHVPAIQHVEPHLTLDGLRLIWEGTANDADV